MWSFPCAVDLPRRCSKAFVRLQVGRSGQTCTYLIAARLLFRRRRWRQHCSLLSFAATKTLGWQKDNLLIVKLAVNITKNMPCVAGYVSMNGWKNLFWAAAEPEGSHVCSR